MHDTRMPAVIGFVSYQGERCYTGELVFARTELLPAGSRVSLSYSTSSLSFHPTVGAVWLTPGEYTIVRAECGKRYIQANQVAQTLKATLPTFQVKAGDIVYIGRIELEKITRDDLPDNAAQMTPTGPFQKDLDLISQENAGLAPAVTHIAPTVAISLDENATGS